MRQEKLITIGEAHIEFVPMDMNDSLETSDQYVRIPGGSPVNVAVTASKFGIQTEFFGKLGKDPFGDYIKKLLPTVGVGTNYLLQTHLAPTHVIFSSQGKDGEQLLLQTSTSDGLLRPDDLNKEWINRGDMIYFSSRSLSQNPSRATIEKAISYAGEKGAMIAFAPQLRVAEWPNEKLARETVMHSIPFAHLLILSEEELKIFTGKEDEFLAIKEIFGGKTKCMIIMRGNKGITYVTERDKGNIRFSTEDIVDQSGIDDAFIGYLVADMLQQQATSDHLSDYLKDVFDLEERLEKGLRYGYLKAQKRGSLMSMPEVTELTDMMSGNH